MQSVFLRKPGVLCGVAAFCVLGGLPPSYAEVTFDGTMGPQGSLSGQMVIPENMGTRAGRNLFHSFGVFNINQGESATFTSDFSGWRRPRNVIGRVTGGDQSTIDGLLSSTIAGADIWLINPSGIMFGENAEVDVPASFHASTGDYVSFADGEKYPADPSAGPPVLSVASPVAFGFLGPARAGINIQDATLTVGTGETISLVGGDVTMTGGTVSANGGRIIIASTDSQGEVVVDKSMLALTGFETLGDIEISGGALVDAGGQSGGRILIRSGQFALEKATVESVVESLGSELGVIDIASSGDVVIGGKAIVRANTKSEGDGARIRLSGQNITIDNKSKIVTRTDHDGEAGSIVISARGDFSVLGNSKITTTSKGDNATGLGTAGSAGSIFIRGNNVTIDGSEVSTTTEGDGDAGLIRIKATADSFVLSSSKIATISKGNNATDAGTAGTAGSISIDAHNITIDNSDISITTEGDGDAGSIGIEAENDICINPSKDCSIPDVAITNNARSSITTLTTGLNAKGPASAGSAGSIVIDAGNLLHVDGAGNEESSAGSTVIRASTNGTGNAGSIHMLSNGELRVRRGTAIEVVSTGENTLDGNRSGNTGSITIDAGLFKLTNSRVSALTERDGATGSITISGDQLLRVTNDSDISVLSKNENTSDDTATGNVGGIHLSANGLVEIKKGGAVRVETSVDGNTGSIDIEAPGTVFFEDKGNLSRGLVLDDGEIRAATQGRGDSGNIKIDAISLDVRNGAGIFSNTQGTGNAGTIDITAKDYVKVTDFGQIQLQSTGKNVTDGQAAGSTGDLKIAVTSGVLEIIQNDKADKKDAKPDTTGLFVFSGRSGDRGKGGATGDIIIDVTRADDVEPGNTTPSIKLSSGQISSRTYSRSDGGDVTITTDGGILIETGTTDSGKTIAASQVQVQSLMRATDEQGDDDSGGNAGDLLIEARTVKLTGGGTLTSVTQGSGDGGSILVKAGEFEMNGGVINASGQLPERPPKPPKSDPSAAVLADQSVSGKGGDITLDITGSISIRDDSRDDDRGNIRSIANADGDAGNIKMTANRIDLGDDTKIETTAKDVGNAGDITLNARDSITVSGTAIVTTNTTAERKRVDKNAGDGGSIKLHSMNAITISGESTIASVTKGDGDAGDIEIRAAKKISILEMAEIKVDSIGPRATSDVNAGNGGDLSIVVTEGNLFISGNDNGENDRVNISADSGSKNDCNCFLGNAGNIIIEARGNGDGSSGNIQMDNAAITSNAWGESDGGSVILIADGQVNLADQVRIEVTTRKTAVEESDGRGKGGNAGDIRIDGGLVTLAQRSRLKSITNGSGDGGGIRVDAAELLVNDGVINASGQLPNPGQPGQSVSGAVGDITLNVDGLLLLRKETKNAGTIRAIANAEGNGGSIIIQAGAVELRDGGEVLAVAQADGDAGLIYLAVVNSILVDNASAISTSTTGVRATKPGIAGAGGRITIEAASLAVTGNSQISSSTLGDGNAGTVRITVVDGITVSGGSEIAVRTRGDNATSAELAGSGGDLIIRVRDGDLIIDGQNDVEGEIDTGFFATSGTENTSGGVGGSISIDVAGDFRMDGGRIEAGTLGESDGGSIEIEANAIQIADQAAIAASTKGDGTAGSIRLMAENGLVILGSGLVSVNTSDEFASSAGTAGDGGDIQIELGTSELRMMGDSRISSNTAAGGDGGAIEIEADRISLFDSSSVTSDVGNSASGSGGTVRLVTREILLSDDARISTDTAGGGNGGAVDIAAAQTVQLTGRAAISSNAESSGSAGTLRIKTSQLDMVGQATIVSNTSGSGDGGTLTIAASRLAMADATKISSDTSAGGDGGNATLTAEESILLSDDAVISSDASDTGAGGNVTLTADQIIVLVDGASVTSRADANSSGAAGSIKIDTNQLLVDSARIDVTARGTGIGGSIDIVVGDASLTNGALITAASEGPADAGSVTLDASGSVTLKQSRISTSSSNAEGGDIRVSANDSIFLDGSEITAEANGDGGNLFIGDALVEDRVDGGIPDFVVLRESTLRANANEGDGGNILITTNAFVADINSIIDASSNRGLDGEVRIEAPNNITGTIVQLETPNFDVSDLLASTCAPRDLEDTSSFAVRTSVVPPLPDDYRASPLQWLASASTEQTTEVETHRVASASEIPCNF